MADNGASAISGQGTLNQKAGAGVTPANSSSLFFGNVLTSVYVANQEASDQGQSAIRTTSNFSLAGNLNTVKETSSTQEGVLYSVYGNSQEASDQGASYINQGLSSGGSGIGAVFHYKMMGQDHTTSSIDTWVVLNAPDYSATQYAGVLTLPLRNITIAGSWSI